MEHKFLFYIWDGKTGQILEDEMLLVGSALIDKDNFNTNGEYFEEISEKFNSNLRQFLIDQNIKHFIPLKNPSIEFYDDCVTICYYHNKKAYDIIYQYYPEYIMMPNAVIEAELNELYFRHGLDEGWYDHRSNVILEDEEGYEDDDDEIIEG